MQDGSPILANATFTTNIFIDAGGTIRGETYVDRGAGPQLIRGENSVYWLPSVGSEEMMWVNEGGTLGMTYYNSALAQWENVVLSGANAGRITALHRL